MQEFLLPSVRSALEVTREAAGFCFMLKIVLLMKNSKTIQNNDEK